LNGARVAKKYFCGFPDFESIKCQINILNGRKLFVTIGDGRKKLSRQKIGIAITVFP
jgi:uncharacterized protein Veg